nr:reverse transcriptase domain-containing protein [Tanacetum cinerariifolium]GEY26068.1 reverse transcriptase domain-containing protein [Tanacetum cinerariifolium]
MVKEGIVLGHKVSSARREVDKSKINVILKLPPPTNIKGIRSFLRRVGFYRRFIKDLSKIARPLTKLLEKDTPFEFNDECQKAFELLKEKLTCAPMIVSLNLNLPFELMYDVSDFAVGAVVGPFSKSYKFEYILVAVDYVSNWAEAQALPTIDARVVVTFLKKLFFHFRMPKALISDRDIDLNNLSYNDLRSSNKLHNWYQSLVAHDLGSTRLYDKQGFRVHGLQEEGIKINDNSRYRSLIIIIAAAWRKVVGRGFNAAKGKIVRILDLMIQKSNRMKQKDQSPHCGTLQAGGVI